MNKKRHKCILLKNKNREQAESEKVEIGQKKCMQKRYDGLRNTATMEEQQLDR